MKRILPILALIQWCVLAQTDKLSKNQVFGPALGTGSNTNEGRLIFQTATAVASGNNPQTATDTFTINRDKSMWLLPQSTPPTINLVSGNIYNDTFFGLKLFQDNRWFGLSSANQTRVFDIRTECTGAPGNSTGPDWLSSSVGAATFTGSPTHWGVFNLGTFTSTTGVGILYTSPDSFLLGQGSAYIEGEIRTPSVLSDGTDSYTLWFGFGNSITAVPTSGLAFRYTHSVNGGRWEIVSSAGGVETAVDSGLTVSISVWARFLIEMNSSGTSVSFYYATAGSAYTLVGTITTNLPVNSGQEVGAMFAVIKTLGTTARAILTDYAVVHYESNTLR